MFGAEGEMGRVSLIPLKQEIPQLTLSFAKYLSKGYICTGGSCEWCKRERSE